MNPSFTTLENFGHCNEIEEVFFRFLASELPLKDLEQWIYLKPQIEGCFGKSVFLEFISFNFQQPAANYEFSKLINKHISPDKFFCWQIKRLLQSLLDKTQDAVVTFEKLYDLYGKGYHFLDDIGIQYVLGVDEIPTLAQKELWDDDEFFRRRKLLDNYVEPLKDEIQILLQALDAGEIKILNEREYSISPEVSKKLHDAHRVDWRPKNAVKSDEPKKEWWQFWK